jgi:hypothetical protein
MVKRVDPSYLEGPIPGMSLTSEPGARPWENPPVYVEVGDVVAFYTERILDQDAEDFIVMTLEKQISVEAAANHLVSSGVMNGMHTMDTAFLVTPVVRELLMYVGDLTGVKYVESYDKLDQEKRIPRSLARQIVEEVFAESVADKETMEEQEKPQGLMARPASAPPPLGPDAGMMGAPAGAAAPPHISGRSSC